MMITPLLSLVNLIAIQHQKYSFYFEILSSTNTSFCGMITQVFLEPVHDDL